jgi:4-diphosphocytidyl-2-C-methyl-D-erythritol kinase
MSVSVHANAKVNLHLDIGPRRKDGYHSLKTLFQEISLHDTLLFEVTDGPVEFSASPNAPQDQNNIVVKALLALKKMLKTKKGMKVHLDKKIPMGAGLGGGSSDAAAALKAAWTLWKNPKANTIKSLNKIPPVLLQVAVKLGADVPFFLRGGCAWGEGIGEKLTFQKSSAKRWIVLVYPRVHVSTPEAYRMLDQYRMKKKTPVLQEGFFNSFEPVILKKFREIARAKQTLVDLGCTGVMMSGSGSTVFGFVSDPSEGARVLNGLQQNSWDTFLVYTL